MWKQHTTSSVGNVMDTSIERTDQWVENFVQSVEGSNHTSWTLVIASERLVIARIRRSEHHIVILWKEN